MGWDITKMVLDWTKLYSTRLYELNYGIIY